ncbi:hypothetical protein PVT68_16070 [Microbulbifer bruguierae]|uniref:Uncharacterized protein n=1 Tax=Microbulbifer bruguierae TaxID=3029061 RepID=A0ABY8NBG3_9GAMM|nr:hypothetical protein [Microbulbifer bruguierae]WGL16271.1 hypothetical protein PVT68_16070 [Microbulbifer bruguierae]
MTFIYIALAILWLTVGILAIRNTEDFDGITCLDETPLIWRLIIILFGPVIFLIYERHLFYAKAEPADEHLNIKR